MAVESGLPPLWGTLLDWEKGRETGEGGLNEVVAVLSGLVMVIERAIESLTPGGPVDGRDCQLPPIPTSVVWFPLDR